MFRRILKWVGMALGSLVILIGVSGVILYLIGRMKWDQVYENYDVPVQSIAIPTGPVAISRGEHIATTHYCAFCHGENFGGQVLIEEPLMAIAFAPNLTSGNGGIGAANTTEDWVRAIRHGVGYDGRGLIAMPSRVWYALSDGDLGALIAYLESLPPVDNELPSRQIGPLGYVAVAIAQFPQASAAIMDHDTPRPPSPQPGMTAEYGEYLATSSCSACHGVNMNGGSVRGLDGELVIALNLTPGGDLAGWSEEDFVAALRTGVTPSGRMLDETMPWQYVGQMTDEELRAVWLYLNSLPAMEQSLERTDR